ncbi:MAG TPA: hypothetical protein VEV39_05205 [Gemmatimonadales bacterium]|nr:hypothetical protein [Gemmatimonadales bacterium]
MTNLSRETPPDARLEERVVSALVAAGLVRRRRVWPWAVGVAAMLALAVGVARLRPTHGLIAGHTYVVLLYEDSTYRPAPAGHQQERIDVLSRWADSLATFGEYERAGHLIGLGEGGLGGLFLVRAADDAAAARIAASCPFTQWGGHVEVRRFER